VVLRNTIILVLSCAGIAVAGWRLSAADSFMPNPPMANTAGLALNTSTVFSPRIEVAGTPSSTAAQRTQTPPSPLQASADSSPVLPAPGPETQGDLINLRAVRTAVEAWRVAWEKKDLPAYLAFYHNDFRGRASFGSQKRRVMSRAQYIRVAVKALEVKEESINRFLVSFEQTYESDNYVSKVSKVQTWVLVNGELKILAERSIEPET
jgi:hypothetical protein